MKNTINTMVDQLNSFASEVTRVALEVGTEGKLGGQAKVKGVGGTWKDLDRISEPDGIEPYAQVRNIAEVTTAVAKGDLVTKNYGGRKRRNSGIEKYHQYDGGSVEFICIRSNSCGKRSRYQKENWVDRQMYQVWKDFGKI